MNRRSQFKTCLVLSGGAARAVAHVGVLDHLHRVGFPIDMIVGTSMGALIGALYALHQDPDKVRHLVQSFADSDPFQSALARASDDPDKDSSEGPFDRFIHHIQRGFFYTRSLSRISLVTHDTYDAIVSEVIPDRRIETLDIPFAAVAADLMTGDEIIISRGSLRRAIQASAAIPGLLPPIAFSGRYLVDGGWIDNVPVAPAIRLGAHYTIAVDASWEASEFRPLPDTALELAFRGSDITRMALNRLRRSHADTLLIPDVGHVLWSDFTRIDDCVHAGRTIAERSMPRIKARRLHRRLITSGGKLHPMRRSRWRHPMVLL